MKLLFFIVYALRLSFAKADDPAHPPTDPADWGPAYVQGLEAGPASEELARAFHQAEKFLAQQTFANLYAKRACAGGGNRLDVEFALLSDKTGRTRGVVRVQLLNGKCLWLGQRQGK